jgi:hypothetical protein
VRAQIFLGRLVRAPLIRRSSLKRDIERSQDRLELVLPVRQLRLLISL